MNKHRFSYSFIIRLDQKTILLRTSQVCYRLPNGQDAVKWFSKKSQFFYLFIKFSYITRPAHERGSDLIGHAVSLNALCFTFT